MTSWIPASLQEDCSVPGLYIWWLLYPWDNSRKVAPLSPYCRSRTSNKDVQNTCSYYKVTGRAKTIIHTSCPVAHTLTYLGMPGQLEAKGVGPTCPPGSMGLLVIWLSFQPHLTHTLFSIHNPSGRFLCSSWRALRCFVMFPNTLPSPPTAQPLVPLLPPRCSWSTIPHVLLTLGCRRVCPQASKSTALAASVSPWLKKGPWSDGHHLRN